MAFTGSLRNGPVRRQRDDLAFLPAALEVLETPPNPLGRATLLALCAATLAGVAWSWFGHVDIVAVASGKLVSRERTQVVQPLETATVSAVLVHPGQTVAAGQPLIELDETGPIAERDRARADLVSAELDTVRLQAYLDGAEIAEFGSVAGASEGERMAAAERLKVQRADRASQLAGLDRERREKEAELQVIRDTEAKLAAILPLVAQRLTIREKAEAAGASSLLSRLESQQQLVEAQAELQASHSRAASAEAAIGALDHKRIATEAELRLSALVDLDKARDRGRAAREALVKASRRAALQVLRAPIAGTIQEMHVLGAGSVVTPAQQILSIAPAGDDLAIEAVLDNRDIGFVTPGQRVEVKVDAFPFTRFGVLTGSVLSVDRDAEAAPVSATPLQGAERAADRTDGLEASERLRYLVRVALPAPVLGGPDHAARLLPGMAVKAEIMTGRRRLIDFVLAPLREVTHDSLRER